MKPALTIAPMADRTAPDPEITVDEMISLERIATREAPDELLSWLDTFALAIAAGVRVGERGLHRAPVNGNGARVEPAPCGEPEVMDADQAADFLGVDRKTVYEYAGRGAIPCRRLGKRLLFSRRALVLWLGGECSKGLSNGETQ